MIAGLGTLLPTRSIQSRNFDCGLSGGGVVGAAAVAADMCTPPGRVPRAARLGVVEGARPHLARVRPCRGCRVDGPCTVLAASPLVGRAERALHEVQAEAQRRVQQDGDRSYAV